MKTVESKVIIAFVPTGVGTRVGAELASEKQIMSWFVGHARGHTLSGQIERKGIGEWMEKEVLTVVIPKVQADELFDYIFWKADIDQRHGGFMFMTDLKSATPIILQTVNEDMTGK
ncbi:hypothetical protein MNBD_NITROSPINAE04-192 [hydrothermal vent metagenome]|uniref:Nitrogen regulatory protein P-II n=1 Tax=hydrothermal vent metagenome TaxID=652676 RepID=A0A3B1C6Y4_9ZZZZ